ncbi:MAG TPA: NUDIX hydrolase [Blastocatellia bacterium]|nr:NUDIX hydrolase [Blastocatellia bacterium]
MSDKFSNPWRTVESRQVYDNPWIRVRQDEVIRPDGEDGIYGVVHFKNRAIGVLPIDEEGYTYLVGQYRYPLNRYSWEIPEGGGPEDEEPLESARRELREETGLEARHWELLGHAHLSNSVTDEEALYYLATGLVQLDAQPEGTERLELMRVPFAEALRMVLAGEITDALSVLAIMRYELKSRKVRN